MTLPSVNVVHKAIRNYLVNELGVTREYVMEQVNKIVKEHIQYWFDQYKNDVLTAVKTSAQRVTIQLLERQIAVAVAKAETKVEIVMVDKRMNED